MITFVPHAREDIPLRVRWFNSHKGVLYATDELECITTEDSQNEWFDNYDIELKNGMKDFFTILSGDKRVGFMGLSNMNKSIGNASLFILIGEDKYRGVGIGEKSMNYLINYAFKDLNLISLYLEVDSSNLSAVNLYYKLGFENIGEDGKFILMTLSRPTVDLINKIM